MAALACIACACLLVGRKHRALTPRATPQYVAPVDFPDFNLTQLKYS